MMKNNNISITFLAGIIFLSMGLLAFSISVEDNKTEKIITNMNGKGLSMLFEIQKGEEYNHPSLAIWAEDLEGNYIQTLYVSKAIATGVFDRAKNNKGKWEAGNVRRPAALPYWGHKRNIPAADGLFVPDEKSPVPDAYSGATPQGNFSLQTKLDDKKPQKFRILLEINQPWDWNEYWTNTKFPNNDEYKTSSQPSLVYVVTVDMADFFSEYCLNPIGHGHYAGEDGNLYTDLTTLTTALQILDKVSVSIQPKK